MFSVHRQREVTIKGSDCFGRSEGSAAFVQCVMAKGKLAPRSAARTHAASDDHLSLSFSPPYPLKLRTDFSGEVVSSQHPLLPLPPLEIISRLHPNRSTRVSPVLTPPFRRDLSSAALDLLKLPSEGRSKDQRDETATPMRTVYSIGTFLFVTRTFCCSSEPC